MNQAIVVAPRETYSKVLAELEHDDPTAAVTLRAVFEEMFDSADEWAKRAALIKVTDVSQTREMKLARDTRLALREIRVRCEKARKRLKENIVRQGKAIDGFANILKALTEPLEDKLYLDETFAERAEEARKDALAIARKEALTAYGADPAAFVNLGEMAEETWATTIESARLAAEHRKEEAKRAEAVKLEAERLAAEKLEAERKEAVRLEAERVEREKAQKEENERLRKENARKVAEAKAMLEAHTAEREAAELAADRDRLAAAEKERELAKAADEERAAKERAERDLAAAKKAEADRVAKEEADRIAEARKREAEREAAELAPDKEKLKALALEFRTKELPSFSTAKGKAAAEKVYANLDKLAAWIEKVAGEL